MGGNGDVWGTNRVQEYNPTTDTWEQVASMPTRRHSLDCAVVDGYIYAIGGHVANSRRENERYDPSTNTWESMAPKPTAVSGLGIAAFGGKIYTFGGNRYGSNQSVIEVYDPSTNTWQSVGNMPAVGQPWRAAASGDRIYLAGGDLGGHYDNLWAYDPVSGTWDTSLPKLNIARQCHELVVVGNYLFAIGGSGPLNSVEWWTPGASGWTLDESLDIARSQFGAEAIGNTIYTFGGAGIADPKLSSTESALVRQPATIEATIDIDPDTLNLKSKGKWITCYIELPEGYDVGDIDVTSILLEGLFEVQHSDVQDDVLMVKFDRQNLIFYLESILGIEPPADVSLILTGELTDGTPFQGSDTIKVIDKGGKK